MTAKLDRARVYSFNRDDRLCSYAPVASALVAIVIYLCTLKGTYIFDDAYIVLRDPRINHVGFWWRFWTEKYMGGSADQLFRPLVSMSFAIEVWLHGDRPWAFHLINVILHASVAAVVAILGRRIAGPIAGWIAGLLFAVHPVHVEAVAGLVGRSELACTLATLGGLTLFLNGSLSAGRIAAIGGCFLAALLSKEQGMLFPLILLAAVPFRRSSRPVIEKRNNRLWLVFLLCAILSIYIVWREAHVRFWYDRVFLDWEYNPLVRSEGVDRVLMPVVLLGRYTVLLIAPVRLSLDYGAMVIGWKVNFADPYLYLGTAALVAWGVGFFRSVNGRRWDLFLCLCGLALSYGLIANAIVLIGTNMGERLLYMPSAFALLIVAIGLKTLRRTLLWAMIAAFVVLGGARSTAYALRWNNALQFYRWSAQNQPKSVRTYAMLFNEYAGRNDWTSAEQVGRQCRAALPQCWEAYQMCIVADLQIGNLQGAEEAADAGIRNCPTLELKLLHYEVSERIKSQAGTRAGDRQ